MGNTLREKDLENLDKQTLITMLMMSNTSIAALQQTVEPLQHRPFQAVQQRLGSAAAGGGRGGGRGQGGQVD